MRKCPGFEPSAARLTQPPNVTGSFRPSTGCSGSAASGREVVVVLDDLHRAMRPSLALLRHVARSGQCVFAPDGRDVP